nr:proton-coupled folate transporter-like isoform X2 [Cherax quadricarinatus]
MASERDDKPILSGDSETEQNIESIDAIDIASSSCLDERIIGVEENREQGCCTKVKNALRGITTEPIIFLNVLGWTVQSSVTTNLLLFKVCIEQQYDNITCANLTAYPEEEEVVQKIVTTINMYIDLVTNIPAVFFVLFLGSWSDKHGRKIPLMFPLIGSFLSTVIYFINAYRVELPAMYVLLAAVPRAITGGFITLLMASYSYMADITKIQARTTRVAFLDLSFGLGAPIGLLLSDFLFYRLEYLGNYGVSGIIFFIAVIYTIMCIEDTRGPFSRHHLEASELSHKPSIMCRDLFDIKNIKDTFAVVKKPRPNKGQARILLLMGAMCSMLFAFGSVNIAYLYTKRKFNWTYSQYIQLSLVQIISSILGSIVSCLGGLPLIVTRSIISKVVPREELGKVFSLLASWESIIPLLSNPLYTFLYNATIKVFPGAMYFLNAIFFINASVIYIWIFSNRRDERSEHLIDEIENIPDVET